MTGPGTWWFEDFAVGQVFTTQSRTVTEADVVQFAAWSWDTNPVHTDAVASAEGRFGERIAHGLLGMSIAMGLLSRLGVFEGSSVALLGVDGWRFVRPLLIGATVHSTVTIAGARLTSAGTEGVLRREIELLDAGGAVLQTGRIDLMVSTRPD